MGTTCAKYNNNHIIYWRGSAIILLYIYVCVCAGIHAAEAKAEVRRLYYIFTVIVFVLSV